MRELLYKAADHVRRGQGLAKAGNRREALRAYADALRDLHAVKPQRQRDVLLAHVYLSRFQLAPDKREKAAQHDLRVGYSYARTAAEPGVRYLAETLWQAHLLAVAKASSPETPDVETLEDAAEKSAGKIAEKPPQKSVEKPLEETTDRR